MLAAGCRLRLARFWGERHGHRQADNEAHYESQGFRPAVVSHPHHPLSAWSKKGVANRLSATDDRREFPGIFYYTGGVDLCQCISCFSGDFPLFFACFGPENYFTVPNQHHTFSDLREEPGNTGPSPLSGTFSHIHSKTACRGFKSFCPCQKSQVSLLRYLTFSLVCGRIWQRGAPAGPPAVRVVGRWSPVATVQRRPRRQPRQVRPLIFS